MIDLETHPAGTASRIAELETALTRANAANDIWSKNSRETFEAMVAMRDSINEFVPMPSLESDLLQGPENSVFCATVADAVVSALTRANAATAAAYEVAAREVECGCGAGPCQDTANCAEEDAAAIRALATPDQQSALDKLIAEAESRVWREAAKAVDALPDAKSPDVNIGVANAYAAILAAFKPQPDPRDEVIARLVEALDNLLEAITAEDRFHDRSLTITGPTYNLKWLLEAEEDARSALAAAKAVQHG